MADLNKFLGAGGKPVKLHEQRLRVKDSSEVELHELLRDLQKELFDLRTQMAMHQVGNPMRIRQVRKLNARVETELNSRRQRAA